MMKTLEEMWLEHYIPFDYKHHHVRCLAHVINIAIQSALSELCCQPPTNEDDEAENPEIPLCLKIVRKKKSFVMMLKSMIFFFTSYAYV
jgi:hypothetical protein